MVSTFRCILNFGFVQRLTICCRRYSKILATLLTFSIIYSIQNVFMPPIVTAKKKLMDNVSGMFNGRGLRAVTQSEERFAHAYIKQTPLRLSMQWGRTLRFTPVDSFYDISFEFSKEFFCSILFLSMYSPCKELMLSGSPSKLLRIGDQQIYR